jgi:hypothetical protein
VADLGLSVHLDTELRTVNPRPPRGIRSSKTALSANPRWANLILYGINKDMGTRPWKVNANKQTNNHKNTVMIYIYEQTA